MIPHLLLSLSLSITPLPTTWTYEQGSDEFTEEQSAIAIGQTSDNDFLSIRCQDKKYLRITVTNHNHNEAFKPKAYAKIDQNQAIELTGKVWPVGLSINQQYADIKAWGSVEEWLQVIEQMQQGKIVKFRLFDDQWLAQEMTFDLTGSQMAIKDVLAECHDSKLY